MFKDYRVKKVSYDYVDMLVIDDQLFSIIITQYTCTLFLHLDESEDMTYMVDQIEFENDKKINKDKAIDDFVKNIKDGKYRKYYNLSTWDIIQEDEYLLLNAVTTSMLYGNPDRVPDENNFNDFECEE